MALDSRYIPAFSIEDVLLDKDTGAPLAGGKVYFEQDNQRGTPKAVYQITGDDPDYTFTQLPNPVILSSIGTFEDSLGNPVIPYFYPYDGNDEPEYYYIRVENANDVPQFAREAQPYLNVANNSAASNSFENEISNPQFSKVDFDISTSTYTYSFNNATLEEVQIAPDWSIIVSCTGVGTVTVAQKTPIGTLNIPTNPGTMLNINSGNLTRLRLRQRFQGSPNLWGSGYLSASFTGKTYSGVDTAVTMYYSQSGGSVTDHQIMSQSFNADGLYITRSGFTLLPASSNGDTSPDAYVDIELEWPLSTEIDITSIMLASTGQTGIAEIGYAQDSQARQIDHLFHYYQTLLNFKPIPSMLTGWDFPVNPAQFGESGNITTTAAYIWDQTIAKSVVATIPFARNSITGGLQLTTAGSPPEAFLLCQYLSGAEAKKILGTKLSVNMFGYRGSAGGAVTFKIYLFRGSSAAVIPTLGNLIGSLAADGSFTKNNTAGQGLDWTEIPRGNLGQAAGNLSVVTTNDDINSEDNDYGFSGWQITDPALIADTDKFCIITTFSYAAASTVITVNSISLVPGEIPTRPAPMTAEQTLAACQYYYEKTYEMGVAPGTVTDNNARISGSLTPNYNSTTVALHSGIFSIQHETRKRAVPTLTIYDPRVLNSSNAAFAILYGQTSGGGYNTATASIPFSTNFTPLSSGTKTANYVPPGSFNTLTSFSGSGTIVYNNGTILYHYTADARLGIV